MSKKSKLPNGLRIVTHSVKGVESVYAAVGVHVGNRNELDKEIGLSHALEHMLFKGTSNRTSHELNEAPDFVGSQTNAYTGNEQTVYYIKGLKENLELSLDILADQVFNSIFPAEEQKKEMEVIEQEIKRSFDNPNNMAHENFLKVAYKNNRLATPILGSAEQVLSYTPADMIAYYSKHYTPKNMVLSVAGNVKHKDVVELAKKYFGNVNKPFKKGKIKTPAWNSGESLVHKADENQVTVMVGWNLFGRQNSTLHQRASAEVLNAIMSSGMSSKLFKEIREKRGLVYSVGSWVEEYEDAGYFMISGGTDHNKLDEFLVATTEVMKGFNKTLTDHDLQKAKNSLKAAYAMSGESIGNIAIGNINSMQQFKKPYDLKELLDAIDAITGKDVKAIMDLILSSKPVLSIYGYAPQIEDGHISVSKFEEMLKS